VAALAIVFVAAAAGFVGFLSQLRGAETKPARHADGIVVLTGGSSRVSDAMELLADGYGKRLLISGVHPTNAAPATFPVRCRTISRCWAAASISTAPPSTPAATRRRRGAGRTSAASSR
jgi:uncharacterized SAM-binding protein YcdF (DUF218 family)